MEKTMAEEAMTHPTSAARKKLLDQELARYVRLLKEHGPPEKVILFGALAEKTGIHEWSDIDLVVIEKTNLPFYQRLRKVRKLLRPKVATDIMVYTPEEFDRLCDERLFFGKRFSPKGKSFMNAAGKRWLDIPADIGPPQAATAAFYGVVLSDELAKSGKILNYGTAL